MALDLPGDKRKSRVPWFFGFLLLAMLAAVLVYSYRTDIRLEDVLGNMAKKNELISRMKTDLLRSVEAEKNAVLADTDEESRKFAKESLDAAAAVNQERTQLAQLVESGRSGDETRLFGEFDKCWDEFQKVDKELLDFAVRNTNLKAAALSFGKGKEAVDRFERALTNLIERESASPEGLQVLKAAYSALAGMLDIHSLEAPHIIASSDKRMDEIESEMNREADRVKSDLAVLDEIVKGEGRAPLSEAESALADLLKINSEVLMLSRQNTNVKSMELSIGVKRKITAQCLETLDALQNAVRSRSFRATR